MEQNWTTWTWVDSMNWKHSQVAQLERFFSSRNGASSFSGHYVDPLVVEPGLKEFFEEQVAKGLSELVDQRCVLMRGKSFRAGPALTQPRFAVHCLCFSSRMKPSVGFISAAQGTASKMHAAVIVSSLNIRLLSSGSQTTQTGIAGIDESQFRMWK